MLVTDVVGECRGLTAAVVAVDLVVFVHGGSGGF
jgi:hypothetical protein